MGKKHDCLRLQSAHKRSFITDLRFPNASGDNISHHDDDLSLRIPYADVLNRVRNTLQGITSIYRGGDLAGFHQLYDGDQILFVEIHAKHADLYVVSVGIKYKRRVAVPDQLALDDFAAKIRRPVQFEITARTRPSIADWIEALSSCSCSCGDGCFPNVDRPSPR